MFIYNREVVAIHTRRQGRQINRLSLFRDLDPNQFARYIFKKSIVQDGGGRHVQVIREYGFANFRYFEGYSIGPRGGVRAIYSHIN